MPTEAPLAHLLALAAAVATLGCAGPAAAPEPSDGPADPGAREPAASTDAEADGWLSLFDGATLAGWEPKIVGLPLGLDPLETFRVEDGLLKVGYEGYDGDFAGRFGHLFFGLPLGHYRLQIEYRFVGEQVPGGPGWAWRNSGIMVHAQDPVTMRLDQDFPVSVEVQMLGGDGTDERSNGNLCTPGTHVEIGGELVTQHCVNSSSRTFHGDEWVVLEIVVEGARRIEHRLDGAVVMSYGRPQLDPRDRDAAQRLADGAEPLLDRGFIALQAESHPLEVRSIRLELPN